MLEQCHQEPVACFSLVCGIHLQSPLVEVVIVLTIKWVWPWAMALENSSDSAGEICSPVFQALDSDAKHLLVRTVARPEGCTQPWHGNIKQERVLASNSEPNRSPNTSAKRALRGSQQLPYRGLGTLIRFGFSWAWGVLDVEGEPRYGSGREVLLDWDDGRRRKPIFPAGGRFFSWVLLKG